MNQRVILREFRVQMTFPLSGLLAIVPAPAGADERQAFGA